MSPTLAIGRTTTPRLVAAALVAASLLLCLALLEIGVRWLDPQPANRYQFSPDTFYAPIPGARFVYRRVEFAVPVAYNSFGMRDRERSLAPPPGGLRIALLGDSQVEAKEVPLDSTFGQRLERRLQTLHPTCPVEVLNFGVSGYGTVATLARYHALGSRFSPDLVVYAFMDNDLADNVGKDRQLFTVREGSLVLQRLPTGARDRLVRGTMDFVKQHFQSYAFLKFRIGELRGRIHRRGVPAAAAPAGGSTNDAEWEVMRLALAALDARVRESRARLLVVQAGTPAPETVERLGEECRRLGIELFDLAPALAAGGVVRYIHDGHWRSEGHRRAALALEPLLDDAVKARLESRSSAAGIDAPATSPATGTGTRSGR
jgi:hypothetical protein